MRKCRRALCLLLAALMLVTLAPQQTGAAESVYFTAVNDQLLPLNDETMPFWSGGLLYVPASAFDSNDLGIFYSSSRDGLTAVLYRRRSDALICDFSAGTIYDSSSKQVFGGAPLTRGGVVFLPVDSVCRFFGLDYSYTRISYGYLVRIKNEAVVLSDAMFIDAASSPMASRYSRYERAKTQGTSAETPPSSTPVTPAAPQEPSEPVERTVYLAIESTFPAHTELALGYLPAGRAAFLFSPQVLADSGDLLRRLAAQGVTIALRVNASAGAEGALAQIRDANRALWAAANVKTRLVYLDSAGEETVRAVSEAGYCALRFALDYSEGIPSVSRLSTRIFAAADANGGVCRVLLGRDEDVAGSLGALLVSFRTGNCTPQRLTEAVA